MKILKSLSLVLVLTVVFSSFAISSFAADDGDKVIISSIDDLPDITNFKTDPGKISVSENGNVLSLTAGNFANGVTNYKNAGVEARYCLVPEKGGKLGGDIDWSQYKKLRIEFNILIKDKSNGISFRTQRCDSEGKLVDSTNYYVFSVGGETFASYRPTNRGYTYYTQRNSTLGNSYISVNEWHNVVIEIGANVGNKDVKFYIDGEDKSDIIKVVLNSKEIDKSPKAQIHDDTIGFGGGSANKCVLIPNGAQNSPFGVELSGLKMTATNTDFTPRAADKITVEELKGTANTETGKIDTSAIVYNLTGETKNVKLIIAYYDSEKNLADVKTEVISVANTLVNNVNKAFDKPSAYASAKVFLWTDTEIIPLAKSADVK